MNSFLKTTPFVLFILMLSSCASVPNGPSSMALPGTGKDWEQFRADDSSCRQFAHEQVGGSSANQASNESFAKSAAVGTALGATVGAAAGGGHGAGTGAAMGLLVGSIIGVDEANFASSGTQHRYDNAYIQCMYAKGHQVPVSGRVLTQQRPTYNPSTPAAAYPPPPPPPGYTLTTPPDVSN